MTVEHIAERWPLVIAFVLQNLLSAATAVTMSQAAKATSHEIESVAEALVDLDQHGGDNSVRPVAIVPPLPLKSAVWGGYANGISHFFLIACWVSVLWATKPS